MCSTRKSAPANASTAASLIDRAPSDPPNTRTHVSPPSSEKRCRAAGRALAGGGPGRPGTRERGGPRPSGGKARQTRGAKGPPTPVGGEGVPRRGSAVLLGNRVGGAGGPRRPG